MWAMCGGVLRRGVVARSDRTSTTQEPRTGHSDRLRGFTVTTLKVTPIDDPSWFTG